MLLTQWLSRFSLSQTRRHRRRPQVQDVFRQFDRVDVLEDRVMLSAVNWIQLGENSNNNASINDGGDSVSLSADGNTVAISGYDNGTNAIRIFRYDDDSSIWDQLRGTIVREGSQSSVSLSADGGTVAIGGGQVGTATTVFRYDSYVNVWDQLGADIDEYDLFGVSLSADGNTIVIANLFSIRIFHFDPHSYSWFHRGQNLIQEFSRADTTQGMSYTLSADGATVAIGLPALSPASGYTHIFRYGSRSGATGHLARSAPARLLPPQSLRL